MSKLYRFLPSAAIAFLLLAVGGGVALAAALQPLATDCSQSRFEQHDGFQNAPRCVSTAHGEVAEAALNPSLLIVDAPDDIREGKSFKLKISSRNLVRDRFLAAGQGGYYLETALLNEDGLTRGHIHVACRALESRSKAPNPEPAPQFFKAIEDSKGGKEPDTVTVEVPGKVDGKPLFRDDQTVQCAAWAGDGSHRTPLMQRANQTPAFDTVRIKVK